MNDLSDMIQQQSNNKALIWSEIITRTDDKRLSQKVNEVNDDLAKLCTGKNWGLVRNNNTRKAT